MLQPLFEFFVTDITLPFTLPANNIDSPSSCIFNVNCPLRLSQLIEPDDEGNVSTVTVKPLICEVIDKKHLSFWSTRDN